MSASVAVVGRVRRAGLLAAALGCAAPRWAGAQAWIQLRGATGGYRYADVSYTFRNRIVLDANVVAFSDGQVYYVGGGFGLGSDSGWSVTPIVYRVFGTAGYEQGIALGAYLYLDGGGWRAQGFGGRFVQTGGSVPGYTYVDAFDLTRVIGPWEVGASVSGYEFERTLSWLVGPTFKLNDGLGWWAVSWRTGDEGNSEFRVIRTLEF